MYNFLNYLLNLHSIFFFLPSSSVLPLSYLSLISLLALSQDSQLSSSSQKAFKNTEKVFKKRFQLFWADSQIFWLSQLSLSTLSFLSSIIILRAYFVRLSEPKILSLINFWV